MEVKRILIVKPSSFGDIVHSLPFLHVVRRSFPHARITWVVSRSNMDLLTGHPDLDEVLIFERERWGGMKDFFRSASEFSHFVRRLREGRFDLAVDLQGLFRSALLTFATGARERVGFSGAREWSHLFYNVPVEVPDPEMHAVDRYLLVARRLSLDVNGAPEFNVFIPPEAHEFAGRYLASANPERRALVVLLPASRWVSKRWPPDCFAELAGRVEAELDAAVLFLGGRDDVRLAGRIRGMMKRSALSLVGETTLKQSAAVLARADAVVANDTGPMHLAAALGVPVVALYGPTSPARTGPYGRNIRLLVSQRECAPCFEEDCEDPECMRDISVDEVCAGLRKLLESRQ